MARSPENQVIRKAAIAKLKAEGRPVKFISAFGTNAQHKLYVAGASCEEAYPNAQKIQAKAVNIPLPVKAVNPPLPVTDRNIHKKAVNIPLPPTVDTGSAVNPPLPPVMKSKKSKKNMLANGRTAKGVPDFKNWFGRVYPADITYPAWKHLSKTATDIANICRAKRDHAAAKNKKDSSGVPVFEFPFSEAVNTFKISRPTFDKSIKQLLEIGLIEYSSPGGIVNGQGIPARYRMSDKWKSWTPTENTVLNPDDRKKLDAMSAKQNPSKPVLHRPVNIPLPVEANLC